jgi:hypothetical protein
MTTSIRMGLLAATLLAPRGAAAFLADRDVHPPVNYFVLVPPAAGQSYLDPVFGTAVRRLSDARQTANAADGGVVAMIGNEYSTMSPFNDDGSRLLLAHQSYFALYDGEGRYQRDLPFEISAASEPRWSRRDPNLFYYLYGNALKSYDAGSGARAVVRTFTGYAKVQGRGESDICFDGDHLVLVGDDRDVFVYEISTDTAGPVLDTTGHPFDSVSIAPGDQVIVAWLQGGVLPRTGIELFDRDMRFLRQLAPAGGHMDVGRDVGGEPVLLWINAADPLPRPDCQNAVVKVRLADAQQTCVLPLPWGLAAHVSVPDAGDWFFVSTYAPADPLPVPGPWALYAGEVMQVRLDGSEVRRLAHHRSRPFNSYGYTPRAAASRDGRRVVYSSNFGLPQVLGYGSYYADAYLLDLGASTPAYAGSQLPLVSRYEQDDPSVNYTGSWYLSGVFFHSGGSAELSAAGGARAAFTFTGTSVRWIGYRDEWSGQARVWLDGQLLSTVNTYAVPGQAQQPLFSAGGLLLGRHTLEIEPTGVRELLGGPWVWVDAFEVTARVEHDDAAVAYAGAWEEAVGEPYSGGRALRATEPGAQATFRFRGRAVSWIGRRDEGGGIARVLLDSALRSEVDTYAAASEAQTVVYTLSGLPAGEHTLAIEVSGRRHPLSSGTSIWVDAFETVPE